MSSKVIETTAPVEYLNPADELDEKTRTEFEDVRAAIRIHGQELLDIPGVLFVRVGYRFRNGKLTQQPALVVGVVSKADISYLSERSLVPRKLGSVAVDVVPATPEEILLFRQTQSAFHSTPRPQISLALPGEEAQGEFEANFAPIREYVPPAEPLSPITEEMTVICHASPDAGWRILRDFLLNTESRLTSTMYEFNARHVLDTLVAALTSGGKTMSLILDAGHQDVGAGDVSKTTVRQTLTQALPGRFKFVWAAVGDDNVTTAAFFKNAYHIKVSVRDGTWFWLSSGNWKRSGQPTIDPINGPFPRASTRPHSRAARTANGT